MHPQNFQEGSDGNQKAFDGTIDSPLEKLFKMQATPNGLLTGKKSKLGLPYKTIRNDKTKFLKTMGWGQLSNMLRLSYNEKEVQMF